MDLCLSVHNNVPISVGDFKIKPIKWDLLVRLNRELKIEKEKATRRNKYTVTYLENIGSPQLILDQTCTTAIFEVAKLFGAHCLQVVKCYMLPHSLSHFSNCLFGLQINDDDKKAKDDPEKLNGPFNPTKA